MLEFLFYAFLIGCFSWCYHTILREFLLSAWFRMGYKYFGKYEGTWREYIYKPVWGCQYCTSGQIALWCYLLLYDHYNLFAHISFITLSIFLTNQIFKHAGD